MATSQGPIDSDNYTIGGAMLYYNATVGNQNCLGTTAFWTAANNMGNIVTSEVMPDVTYTEHWRSKNGALVKDKEVVNKKSINITFTFDEMNQNNLRRFLMGTDSSASKFNVLDNVLEEGCGHLVIKTDVGQDFIYRFPKCTLRPDGALTLDPESWHEAGFVLNIIEYLNGDCTNSTLNATWLGMPFGEVDSADL